MASCYLLCIELGRGINTSLALCGIYALRTQGVHHTSVRRRLLRANRGRVHVAKGA